jgi:transcriptional regulator with GAF, ATPase, and Fis domain
VGQDTPLRVDVRIITATNVDLKEKVRSGSFREDLYFRLRVIDIILPPLRERGNDILQLADHFIEKIAPKVGKTITGISDQARQLLLRYSWPGNVRELEHVIERACVLCNGSTLSTEQLSTEITSPHPTQQVPPAINVDPAAITIPSSAALESPFELTQAERLLQALKKTGGNKAKAARLLGIDRTTLYRKIRELNLDLSGVDL